MTDEGLLHRDDLAMPAFTYTAPIYGFIGHNGAPGVS